MPESPTAKKILTNHRTLLFCLSLLLIELAFSFTLFYFSHRKYTTWYRTTHALHRTNDLIIHTTLFIATCAPLCVWLGMCAAAAYYWRKKRKYGKYAVNMRRRGRGYWVDPSDKVDGEKEREAKRRNEEGGKEKTEIHSDGAAQQSSMLTISERDVAGAGQSAVSTSKRVSFFSNPYGWVAKKTEPELSMAERALGRSDSLRTCDSDEVMKRAVTNIWLARSGSVRRGEDIEMQTRHTK